MTPGQQLRAARTAVDLSLGDMARKLPWSKAALGFYETDQRPVPNEVIAAYTEVVGQERRRLTEEGDMRRRALLALGAAAVPGLVSGAGDLPGGGRDLLGNTDLDQLEALAIHYRDWNERTGGGLQLQAVLAQVNQLAELASTVRKTLRRARTYRIMARFAQTAATMFWDTGDDGQARQCYELAMRASIEADDRAGEVKALVGMGRQQLILGHAAEAHNLTSQALDRSAGRVSAALLAKVYTRHAWSNAKVGEIGEFRRATDQAGEMLSSASGDDGSSFDEAEYSGTTGARLLELAHHDRSLASEAATYIETALATREPTKLRSRALDQIGIGEALLLQGELDEACIQGHQALEVALQTASDHVRNRLNNFLDLAAPFQREPHVEELREHIRSALSA